MRTFFAQVETRFLAVICVLRVITIIEYGKIKSENSNESKK